MIPTYITVLDKLPLNINGKIEKKKLPPIDFNFKEKEIIKPKNFLQNEILLYLKEITKIDKISIDDDFVNDLCLDSLSSMELATKLYKYNINIQDISNYSSIEKLSNKILSEENADLFNNKFINVEIKNKIFNFNLSNILLTGATGFLGTHILKELILNPNIDNIYCLVREKNNKTPAQRIEKIINIFFEQNIKELANKKIKIVNGNFIYDNLNLSITDYNNLLQKITTVIHCGAKVKHFGKYDDFYNSNVLATKNIIEFCKKSSANLAYISTLSVGGLCKKNENIILDENKINIKQEFKNQVYMYTKHQAECEILNSINNNEINAKIFRLGNIMPRLSDGLFQSNYRDNAFICKIHTLINNNIITKNLENYQFDLSPVDLCAQAIIKLIEINNEQTIYHIYNNNKLSLKEFFNLANIELNYITENNLIMKLLNLNNVYDTHLLNDLKYSNFIETPVENKITINILNNSNFYWNKIDNNYINKIIKIQGEI